MIAGVSKCKFKFIDSLNLVKGKLANFPKIFGFEHLAKGY